MAATAAAVSCNRSRLRASSPCAHPKAVAVAELVPLTNRPQSKSSIVTADVRRLRATSSFREVTGEPTDVVLEDVWLGSVLQRIASSEAGFSAAVHYMQVGLARAAMPAPPFIQMSRVSVLLLALKAC